MKKTGTESRFLIARYLNDQLRAPELRELERHLQEDEELRREFLRQASMEAELREIMREREEPATTGERPALLSRPRRALWPWIAIPVPIAAALLVVLGTSMRIQRRAEQEMASPVASTVRSRPVALGRIVAVNGRVEVKPEGNFALLARADMYAVDGDTIAVGDGSGSAFRYSDGSQLQLYKNTRLRIERENGAKHVVVEQGAFDADVTPQDDVPMIVSTPRITASVLGTKFRLLTDERSSWLGVREGVVEVERNSDGKKLKLRKGEYAVVIEGGPFMRLTTVCPYWRGQCRAMTGNEYR